MKHESAAAYVRSTDGALIREAREALGMTQDACAVAAGMTRSHLGLVEQGRSSLSPEKACRLALVLGITLDEIYRTGHIDRERPSYNEDGSEER